jgi:hypothetical protein
MVTAFNRQFADISRHRRPGAALHAGSLVLGFLGAATLAGAGPAALAADEETLRGPDVTIIAEEERVIHEFRQGGELRMVRIVPTFGRPYYLVPRDPTRGFGDLERADMLLPSWVIVEF